MLCFRDQLKMPSAPATFWQDRFRKSGHTGWNDSSVYAYDQEERLAIVDRAVGALALPLPATALDFGCGSGDFSRLLLRRGFDVIAHDPYVRPAIEHPRFSYFGDPTRLDAHTNSVDLVISVTVLDHVLDHAEFASKLVALRQVTRPQGALILLEYALDAVTDRLSDYQAFRPLDVWKEALAQSGWRPVSIEPVPHPQTAPSVGYRRYAHSILTRVLRRWARLGAAPRSTAFAMRRHARRVLSREGIGRVSASPLKLLVCRLSD